MTRRTATTITILLTIAICAVVSFLYPPVQQWAQQATTVPAVTPGFYQVTHVTDGDTIEVQMGQTTEKIRMIGVDTPETKKPNAPVQCFGPEASAFAAQKLNGAHVRLEADPTNDNRDRYGRLLRYVYLPDGSLFARTLITEGYGFAYLSFEFLKTDEFSAAQAEAQAHRRGLWAACMPMQKDGRWQSNDL